MTAPIPHGAPRQRPSRSCVPCRKTKTKCKGADRAEKTLVDGLAVEKCERCRKLDLECEFVPLKRKGRPRRLPRAPEEDESSANSGAGPSTSKFGKAQSSTGSSTTSSPAANHLSSDALVMTNKRVYDFSRLPKSPSPGVAMMRESCTTTPFPMPFTMTPPFDLPPLSEQLAVGSPRSQHIDNIAQGYIALVHSFLPILPPTYDYLTEYLKSATPLLSLAISTILQPHSELSIDVKLFGSTLQDIQAALIFVYWAYGRGDFPTSLRLFRWLEAKIIAYGWHQLDEPGRANSSSHSHLASLDEREKEMIRSLFWEAWCSEVTLVSLAGSNKMPLHEVEPSIFQPQAARSDRCYGPSPFALKIRCYSIMSSVVKRAAAGIPRDEAVALTDICRNLATLAYQSYVASSKALSQTTTPTEYALASADCEAAFMAGLSASAGGVYVPSLPMFVPTAFICGHDTTKEAPQVMYGVMRTASRQAFQLCQASLAPATSPIVHSPFFTCALFVSAQGLITTLRDDPAAAEQAPLNAASTFSDLELGEFVLDKGSEHWLGARKILHEIQMLRLSISDVDEGISSRIVRPGAIPDSSRCSSSTNGSSPPSNTDGVPAQRLVNPVAALQETFGKTVDDEVPPISVAPTTIAPSAVHI